MKLQSKNVSSPTGIEPMTYRVDSKNLKINFSKFFDKKRNFYDFQLDKNVSSSGGSECGTFGFDPAP